MVFLRHCWFAHSLGALRLAVEMALLSFFSSSLCAQTSGVLSAPLDGGSLGTLNGWAAFGIIGHADAVWVVQNAVSGGDPSLLAEALSGAPKVIRAALIASPEVSTVWFERQSDFERAAEQACGELRGRKLMSLEAGPLFPGLGGVTVEESAITVIKVTSLAASKGLAIASAPVLCSDPQEVRLNRLLTRSSVMLAYAAAAAVIDRAKSHVKDKKNARLLEIAALRQVLQVLRARQPWLIKHVKDQGKMLARAEKKMTNRLSRLETKYRATFSGKEDRELLTAATGLSSGDWSTLGMD